MNIETFIHLPPFDILIKVLICMSRTLFIKFCHEFKIMEVLLSYLFIYFFGMVLTCHSLNTPCIFIPSCFLHNYYLSRKLPSHCLLSHETNIPFSMPFKCKWHFLRDYFPVIHFFLTLSHFAL